MADAYGAGLAFRDLLGRAVPVVKDATLNTLIPGRPLIQAAAPTIHDFLAGAINGPQNSITVPLPAATPAKNAPKAAVAAATTGGEAPAGKAAAAAAADPLSGLGNLSFRQLLTLSQASQALVPKGVARQTPTADAAGNLLMQMTMPTFRNTLKAAKTDGDKQKVIDNYRDQVLLPIISHGNPMSGMFDQTGGGGGAG